MEPNNNPNPTPNPMPNSAPGGMPNSPAPNSVPNGAPSEMPNAASNLAPKPVSEPAPQGGSVPDAVPVAPKPVNPVINPGVGASGVPGADMKNPVIQPGGQGLAATDPIMMPEPAPAPDPIEEELKAPMKANDPVPGSIGSAVSGPAASEPNPVAENPFMAGMQDKATNVSFNDPAMQPDGAQPSMDSKPKKKTNKATLIALIVVFVLIIGVLAVFLVMQMMPPANNATNNTTKTETAVVEENGLEEEVVKGGVADASSVLQCNRNMTENELKENDGATSGKIEVEASFDNKRNLMAIAVREYTTDSTKNETYEVKNQELLASEITVENSADYYLTVDPTDKANLNLDAIKTAYELDFACEVL